MAEKKRLMGGPGANPDLAAAVLNTMEPIFSIPIYLITIFFPRFRHIFSTRPWILKFLSVVVAGGVAASFILKLVRRLWGESLWNIFLYWTTSDVYVSWDDSLFGAVLRVYYSSDLLLPNNKCSIRTIRSSNNTELEDELDRELCSWGTSGTFMQHSQFTRQFFRYKGRIFFIHDENKDRRSVIRCLGWSNKPIERMLEDEFASHEADWARRATSLYVPKNQSGNWRSSTQIPVRGLDSVEMDCEEKAALVSDIGRYLEGKEWYRSRCVPWRRGYLFHGPPGTGKTSIVKAIAAHFRLPICAIALSSGLNDSNLQSLCRRVTGLNSIVLLEDIDSAGLERPSQASIGTGSLANVMNTIVDEAVPDKKKKASLSKESEVTLAGLLNAIDGVGAPEGQILIMTSNHAENLDPALTRPGRIDYRLKFDLATKEQAKSIFLRLQAAKDDDSQLLTRLTSMAQTFADKIPDKVLSPADLQDFLLRRRDEPQRAIDELDKWVDEKLVAERVATDKTAADKTAVDKATADEPTAEKDAIEKDATQTRATAKAITGNCEDEKFVDAKESRSTGEVDSST